MTVNRTTLLDLPLPVTGTESGTWGDTTNNGLTQYVDIAIAGTLVLSTDADVTLTSTEGDSSATNIGATTAQYAILRWTATGSTTRNITALAQSKTYVVINATGGTQSIVLRGAGPTTGVTIISGEKAHCVWNGSDFVKVSSSAAAGGSNTQVQYNSSGVLAGVSGATTNGTAITFSTTNLKLQGSSTGVSSFASANSSATDYTVTFPAASTTIPVATQTLTFSGPTAARTITLPDANFTAARTDAAQTFTGVQTFSSNPVLDGGTANGVLYLNGSKVATSGSALTFDGTKLVATATTGAATTYPAYFDNSGGGVGTGVRIGFRNTGASYGEVGYLYDGTFATIIDSAGSGSTRLLIGGTEQMRLTSTGLGIGTSSPQTKFVVSNAGAAGFEVDPAAISGATYSLFINRSTSAWIDDIRRASTYQWRDSTGTERMRLDSSGNLGIGTTSPAYKLSVVKPSAGITARFTDGDGITDIYGYGLEITRSIAYIKGSGALHLGSAAGYSAVILDSAGNLGLGVTPSAWGGGYKAMTINQGRSIAGTNTGAGDFSLVFNAFYDATDNRWEYEYTGDPATRYSTNSGTHAWFTAPSGTAGNAISFGDPKMTLDASGNLAVGNTSSGSFASETETRLSVGTGSANTGLTLYTGSASYGQILWADGTSGAATYSGILRYDHSINAMQFYTNGLNERARITSGGDLLVGVTSAYAANGVTITPGFLFASKNANVSGAFDRSGSSDGDALHFRYNGNTVGSVSVTSTATAYNTSSDYRLKDNQQPLTGSGAFIDALKPKIWNWKADGSKGVGFIAHEVQAVSPGSVVGEKDAVDEEGKPIMQTMEYGSAEFIANIIAELQSLRQRVAELEGK